MDIEYKMLPKATLQEFADSHGFSMVVTESLDHGKRVYRAHFKENVVLSKAPGTGRVAVWGEGNSPSQAIEDYAAQISDKKLIHLRYVGSENPIETYIRSPLLTFDSMGKGPSNLPPNNPGSKTLPMGMRRP